MNSYAFAVYPTLPATLWDKLVSTIPPLDYLYLGRDSNSQAIKPRFLRPLCLPIPPPRHCFSYVKEQFLIVISTTCKYNIIVLKSQTCFKHFLTLARVEGFEPSTTVLETGMIPFHHTRVYFFEVSIGIEPI